MSVKKMLMVLLYIFFIISSLIFSIRDILEKNVTLKIAWFILLLIFGTWQFILSLKNKEK